MENYEIYLYIGMGKAGSGYIKRLLSANDDALRIKEGVFYYRKKAWSLFGIPVKEIGIEEIVHRIRIGQIDNDQFRHIFISKIYPRFRRSGCNKLIMTSNEMLMMNDKISFVNVLRDKGFNVKVIVYIRRPVEFLASVWGERLKPYIPEQMIISIEEEADYYHIQFNTVLEFINLLGKDNVIVRPFEKEQWKNGSFAEDWLSCIGVDTVGGFILDGIYKNPSYSRNLSEIFLLINRIGLPLERTQYYKKRLLDVTDVDDGTPITDTISDEYIDRITNQYRPILQKIAEIYGMENIFLNEYPRCYHTAREEFNQICISMKQMEIIRQALHEKKDL